MSEPIPISRKQKRPAPAPAAVNDEFTERWAGAQFAAFYSRNTLRYVPERATFMLWDGKRWRPAFPVELDSLAKQMVDNFLVEAVLEADERRKKEMLAWARRMCALGKLRTMVDLAASEPILWTPAEKFDAHPHLFNAANCTIDLRTGETRPHDPEDFLTKMSPVEFTPDATAPRFVQFLDETFGKQAEVISFVQRAIGYSFTGATNEHCFFIAHGPGGGGKGTLMRATDYVLGEYATTAAIETFTMKRPNGAQATPDLASLAGARKVTAGEADAGVKLSDGLVKSLTGDDPIKCRHLNQDLFVFRPAFKLWMHLNHKPKIDGADSGIRRRVKLIPFDSLPDPTKVDKYLEDKLRAEASGILAWCVEGAKGWYRDGLAKSEVVATATKEYLDESDVLAAFIEARLVLDVEGFITRKRALGMYAAWAEANGEEPLSPTEFYDTLQNRPGIAMRKRNGIRGFFGLKERPLDPQGGQS